MWKILKIVSEEAREKFDELSDKEFTAEEKRKFNKNHLRTVIFASICVTYIVYVIITA